MSKNLKLYLGITYLIILIGFLYLIFSYVDFTRLNDFLYYKEIQNNFERQISRNLYLNLLIYFLFCILWVSLLGFGTPLLLVSGIFFGKWIGTLISVFSISIGALILYTIANYFFKDLVNDLLKKHFNKFIYLFKKNEFYYFLVFRLTGGLGIPFGLQNILPVIFNIKKMNYFFASFFGLAPVFFIWNTIGSGLNEYIKQAENFSFIGLLLNKEIYLPIILFLVFMLISAIFKKRIFKN
tara:strand:+ start:36 stop:752 length:717 start_codon:yes stop_codon:yes gene_type:complete